MEVHSAMSLLVYCPLLLISLVSSDNVAIPVFTEQSYNCSFPFIDPTLQISKEAYQPRGRVDNCQELCSTETLFNCTSFTWAGPGTQCTLHGLVSLTLISPKYNSAYNLTDYNCVKSGTGQTIFKYCIFEDRGISIAAPSSAKAYPKMTRDDCQMECEMDTFTTCSSYGFDVNATIGAKNCILFYRENTTTTMALGGFRLYENRCRLKMSSCA